MAVVAKEIGDTEWGGFCSAVEKDSAIWARLQPAKLQPVERESPKLSQF